MSQPLKEEQPLLSSSEDETLVCSSKRRSRGMAAARGRATSKMRGAAHIMHLWPDHLSSMLYNCWVALFIMVFMFMVTFGALMTLSDLPNNQFRFSRGLVSKIHSYSTLETKKYSKVNVYCPIIKNAKFNLSAHVSRLTHLKEKYQNYNYNIIILVSDTNETTAKDNNVIAMNSVLNHRRDVNRDDLSKEIDAINTDHESLIIKKIHLNLFMNNSPLKKEWKKLSKSLMPFLIQTVAVWETGGIAFDLNALAGRKSKSTKRNIEKVLRDFSIEDHTTTYNTVKSHAFNSKLNRTKEFKSVNNIRDVIDNLQNIESPLLQANLTSEESKIHETLIYRIKRSPLFVSLTDASKSVFNDLHIENTVRAQNITTSPSNRTENSTVNNKLNNNQIFQSKYLNYEKTIKKIIPNFIRKFFNNDIKQNKVNLNTIIKKFDNLPNQKDIKTEKHESSSSRVNDSPKLNADIIDFGQKSTIDKNEKREVNRFNISEIKQSQNVSNASARKSHKTSEINEIYNIKSHSSYDENVSLVLDMNGALIATKASCHAFIGQIFSTIQKYQKEKSIKKLIDKTLKTFCQDAHYNCSGIRLLV